MNATTETRKIRTERTANIFITSVNVAIPHALPYSSQKITLKLEPARVALESLLQDVQDHIADHTSTILNLFDDVKRKEVGLSKFNKTENKNNMNIPTCLKSMKNPLSGLEAVKGTETYKQFETRMDTLLQNYKVEGTKIILEVKNVEVEKKKKKFIYAMNDCVSDLANTHTTMKIETKK